MLFTSIEMFETGVLILTVPPHGRGGVGGDVVVDQSKKEYVVTTQQKY
jgi:hypothetical protein